MKTSVVISETQRLRGSPSHVYIYPKINITTHYLVIKLEQGYSEKHLHFVIASCFGS